MPLIVRPACVVILSVLWFCSLPPAASASVAAAPDGAPPRTCLVLGGGGARGAAHIGVLKVLERERVPIDCIVGTSMGAIVGGLYASGYSAAQIETVLNDIDWNEVFHDDPQREKRPIRRKDDELAFAGGMEVGLDKGGVVLPRGFVQGQQLMLVLRRLFQPTWNAESFDALPIPFRCVAADIVSGEKVVFSGGDLATAVRASMSVPGVFAPIRVDGRLLVDGGMVANVPIADARALGATRLIVVAVGSNLVPEDELGSPLSVANQMLTAMIQHRSREQIATLGAEDIFIEPELGNFNAAAFDQAARAVQIGEAAALAALPGLQRFARDAAYYAAWREQHRMSESPAPQVQFVRANDSPGRVDQYVQRRFADQIGEPFDASSIEEDVALMYGEGRHESIAWRLTEEQGRAGVEVDAVEKAWGPNFLRFGLELGDNFDGRSAYQALVQARFTSMNEHGGEGLTRLQVGRVLNARAEFIQPWGWSGQFSVSPYAQYRAVNVPIRLDPGDETFIAEIHRTEYVGGVELGWDPSSDWRLSTAVESGRESADFQVGLPFPEFKGDVGLVRARVEFDSLDSVTYPTRGMRLDVSTEFYTDVLGADESADVTRLAFDAAFSRRRDHLLLGLQVAHSNGGELTLGVSSKLGGLANLSGYLADEVIGNQLALARAIYYRRLTSDSKMMGLPLYAGGSVELGGVWSHPDDVDSDDLITAGSLFVGIDSFLGPIFLGYGRAESGVDSVYLRFGPLLRSNMKL